jgi:monoamine oxidase
MRPSRGEEHPNLKDILPLSATHDADVIVVGAGISGLACAATLVRQGHRVIVLEASHHVGGRIRMVNEREFEGFTEEKPENCEGPVPDHHRRWFAVHHPEKGFGSTNFRFDVGGEFIHGPESEMAAEIQRQKIPYDELFTWAHGDGGPSEEPSPHDGGIGFYYDAFTKVVEPFNLHFEKHKRAIESLWDQGERPSTEATGDRRSLRQYLIDNGVDSSSLAFAEAGYANTVGGTLDTISAGLMARCEHNWNVRDGDGDFRVANNRTLYSLIDALVKEPLDVRTKSPVTRVAERNGANCVVATTANGDQYTAKAVVITSSVPVLQKGLIEFAPALPTLTVDAIKSLRCEPAYKIFAKFDRRFWPQNLHGCVCANAFAPELWFDCKRDDNKSEGPCYVTAFFTSDQARRLANTHKEVAIASLHNQLHDMFDRFDAKAAVAIDTGYRGGFSVNWGNVPWIWGGYTTPSLSELPEARDTISAPHYGGRLFFAGEGVNPTSFMTANAAYASGLRAARGVNVTLDHKAGDDAGKHSATVLSTNKIPLGEPTPA